MNILISLLLLAMPGITFTVAQEGTVPRETCQLLTFDFEHVFVGDPGIDIKTLVGPNKTVLERLKRFIADEKACLADAKVFNITHRKTSVGLTIINELVTLQISARKSITNPDERVRQLTICVVDVQKTVGAVNAQNGLAESVSLNASGRIINGDSRSLTVEQQSCCEGIYGSPANTLQCCRLDFIEDGDNCACSDGKFLNVNETRCDDCPEDTYQPNKKSTSCLPCPNGTITYGKTGANSQTGCKQACLPGEKYNRSIGKCETCPRNTYQPDAGRLSCIVCPTGEITINSGSKQLKDCVRSCPPGSFYNFNIGNCQLCPQNSFQEHFGQFNCTSCEVKRITISTGSTQPNECIKNCSRGEFFNQGSEECQECPLHTYQPNFSARNCIDCPDRRITLNTSSDKIEDCIKSCSPGWAYNFTTKDCESCPLNFYQPQSGQTECLACPPGRITVNVSTVNKDECIKDCDAGYIYKDTDCVRCEDDTYKPTKGQTDCIHCPTGTITYKYEPNIDVSDCGEECEPGHFFNLTLWKCEKCPQNYTQNNHGQTTCKQCPAERPITENEGTASENDCIQMCEAGEYFKKDLRICERCEKNSTQPNPGTSKCLKCNDTHITFETGSADIRDCVKACPPGSHHVNRTEICSLCASDMYQSKWGQEECEKCLNEQMTLRNGGTTEEDCFPVCKPGEYHNNKTRKCEPCPLNEYQPNERQFSCISCPKGTLTRIGQIRTSENDCLWDCDKGFYHNATSNTCIRCPKGTYKDSSGHMDCSACELNQTTLTTGSTNSTECIIACLKGSYFNSTLRRCLLCPLNSYQDDEVAIACLPCPNNGYTSEEGTKSLENCEALAATRASAKENLVLLVTVPVVLAVIVLSGCLLLVFLYRRWKEKNERRMSQKPLDPRRRKDYDYEEGRFKSDSIVSQPNHHYKLPGSGLTSQETETTRPYARTADIPPELEIPRDQLKFLGQVLGKGNFGRVEKAILMREGTESVVAVKMIKGGGTFSDEKELFDELEMLASLFPHPHPNIVNLIGGSTTNDGPLFVVVEYCAEGNLLKYLQKNQVSAKPKQEYVNIFPKAAAKPGIQYEWKLQKALEICTGMVHLAKFKIIHRDVAARNVLLDGNWTAKISDFGMARDIYVKQIYRKDTEGFLPVRWMAIESLESFIYTTHSDVWSFGILLWEIISDGRVPYNNILDHTQLLNYIKSGRIMKRPKNCPKDLYHIMEKCWASNAHDRPSFETVKEALELLYEDEVHRDDALPQKILRKFSSRRKRRKPEEDRDHSFGKSRAQKTFSNNSGPKIDKIEEEELNPGSEWREDNSIKMHAMDTSKARVDSEFENKGYDRSGSAASDENVPYKGKPANENTELDTISESPFSKEAETKQGNDSTKGTNNRTLLESDKSPVQREETERRAPIASAENDSISSFGNDVPEPTKGARVSSTDC